MSKFMFFYLLMQIIRKTLQDNRIKIMIPVTLA